MFSKMINFGKGMFVAAKEKSKQIAGKALAAIATVGAALGITQKADAQVTLPDLGVDVGEYATAMGTQLGVVFLVILGISCVFMIGMIAWRWLRRVKG